MKIYPFDLFAFQSGGRYLSQEDLQLGLEPLRKIREALGDQMDVAVEFHGHWNLPIALRIVDSIEPFKPLWLEDIMQPDNLDAYNVYPGRPGCPWQSVNACKRVTNTFQYCSAGLPG